MLTRQRFLCCTSFFIVLFATATECHATPQQANSRKSKSAPTTVRTQTPETTLRAFLTALLRQDAKVLRDTVVPVKDADFAYLVAAKPMPPALLKQSLGQMATLPIRKLKVGQPFGLPDGRITTVPAEAVGLNRALLMPEGWPLPIPLEKTNGRWRVNASSLIAARKAAAHMQQQRDRERNKPIP